MKWLASLTLYCLLMSPANVLAAVNIVEVQTQGQGATLHSAVNNALLEAVSQVNGKSLDAKSQLNSIQVSLAAGQNEGYFATDIYQNQVRTATAGAVTGYEIINQREGMEGGWTVTLSVKVGNYQSKVTARKRIAVLPLYITSDQFSVAGKAVPANRVNRQLSQQLINYLVQSRKFTVLDRDYVSRTMKELNLSKSPQTSVQELARLGEKLVADYVLVGTIEQFFVNIAERKMRLRSGKLQLATGKTHINYRVIEVATGQIVVSDSQQNTVTGNQLQEDDGTLTRSAIVNRLTEVVANTITRSILSQIYPVLVTRVQGSTVILGQGGKGLRAGDHYNVYKYGEQIYDPYTKEYLGRVETYCCEIAVTRVQAKQAYATIVSSDLDIAAEFQPKTFVLREQIIDTPSSDAIERIKAIRQERKQRAVDNDW